MRKIIFGALAALPISLIGTLPARATIIVEVFASPAPNFFGSPSFTGWAANAINALQNSLTAVGNPATDPTAYFQVTQGTDHSNIVTSFNSWNGLANPTGAFANELGNRLQFGVHIVDTSGTFSLSELSFDMHSTDPGNILGFTGDFSADSYSSNRVGLNGSTVINSGAGTQQVTELDYVGVGNALDNTGCVGSNQATIDCVAAEYDAIMPFSLITDYTLTAAGVVLAEGSGTVRFAGPVPVPEPASLALLGSALLGFGVIRRRRRK